MNTPRIGKAPDMHDDDDAPADPHHESDSNMMRRAAAEGARHALEHGARRLAVSNPLVARLLRWVGGGLLFTLSGASAGYFAAPYGSPPPTSDAPMPLPQPACDPLVEQHLQHMARAGGELVRRLKADGHTQYAELVESLTDVNALPDDLRLCLLLAKKRTEQSQ